LSDHGDQEPLWDAVAEAIRESAEVAAPLLIKNDFAQKQAQRARSSSLYEALGEAQLDMSQKIATEFDPLYATCQTSQKR